MCIFIAVNTLIVFKKQDKEGIFYDLYFASLRFGMLGRTLQCPYIAISISWAKCKTAINPLLTHWSYFSFTLSHRFALAHYEHIIS